MTRWLELAWSEVGTAEIAGPQANSRIVGYFARVGHPQITSDEIAWCAGFVGACLVNAGVPLEVPQDLRLRARAYLQQGVEISEPRIGCLAILARHVDGDPGAAHVGFVAGVTETHIQLLGGNQSNAVTVASYPRSQVIGYRWPERVTPSDLEARGSRIATAAKQQQADGVKGSVLETVSQTIPREIPPGIGKAARQASEAMGIYEQFAAFGAFAWSKAPLLLGIAGIYFIARMAWNAYQVRQWRAEDASTGAHQGRPADAEPA